MENYGNVFSIKEVFDFEVPDEFGCSCTCDGYQVVAADATFYVLVSNDQDCCESWGYFSSDDDISSFIGKDLVSVELTDKALNKIKVEQSSYYEDEGGIQFVDFKFSDGAVLQLAVYNAHNGYYGHSIYVIKSTNQFLLQSRL